MAWAASALAWSCLMRLALGSAVQYDLSARTEARASRGESAASELQVDPAASVSFRDGRFDVGATYSPTLILDGQALDRVAVLHRVGLTSGRSGPRGFQLRGLAQGSYGTNKFLSLQAPTTASATGGAPLQPIPRVATLGYMSVDVALQASLSPAPRHSARLELAAFTSGGTDREARGFLPLQRGARVGLGHTWTVSARDQLATDLAGTSTDFQGGPLSTMGTATLTWRRQLTLEGRAWGSAGLAAFATGRRPGETWSGELGLTAVAGAHLPIQGRTLAGGLVVALAPFTDRLTGAVFQRLDFTASLHLRPAPRWSLAATAAGGLPAWAGQRGDEVAAAELRAAWAAARWAEVAAGVRGLWQRQVQADPGVPAHAVREIGFFVSGRVHHGGRL